MAQFQENTTAYNQAQMVLNGVIYNDTLISFGDIGKSIGIGNLCARWQPSIDLTNKKIVIISAYMTVTTNYSIYEGLLDGSFIAPVIVHNGSAGDLTTIPLARDYVDIGSSRNWPVEAVWLNDSVHNSPDMKDAVQLWFNRAGYSQLDWLGIIVTAGDAATEEAKILRDGVNANSPILTINYWIGNPTEKPVITDVNIKKLVISANLKPQIKDVSQEKIITFKPQKNE